MGKNLSQTRKDRLAGEIIKGGVGEEDDDYEDDDVSPFCFLGRFVTLSESITALCAEGVINFQFCSADWTEFMLANVPFFHVDARKVLFKNIPFYKVL